MNSNTSDASTQHHFWAFLCFNVGRSDKRVGWCACIFVSCTIVNNPEARGLDIFTPNPHAPLKVGLDRNVDGCIISPTQTKLPQSLWTNQQHSNISYLLLREDKLFRLVCYFDRIQSNQSTKLEFISVLHSCTKFLFPFLAYTVNGHVVFSRTFDSIKHCWAFVLTSKDHTQCSAA